jgi:predicted nucleic acid-binding protein
VIVIDANILVYSLIECDSTPLAQELREKDADWRTTGLCLHEMLNVLVTYQRRSILTLAQCEELLRRATLFLQVAECEKDMPAALAAAAHHHITGYDAQYVALAQSLSAPLITEDQKLRKAVPGIALSMRDFLAR